MSDRRPVSPAGSVITTLDRLVARGLMVVNAGLRRFNRWLRERRP